MMRQEIGLFSPLHPKFYQTSVELVLVVVAGIYQCLT